MTSKANEIEKIEKFIAECHNDSEGEYTYKPTWYELAEAFTDKFHIIPKTDSPEKHVEIYFEKANGEKIEVSKKWELKLKWREDKQ